MNIISICALAIVSIVLSITIKRHNSELSLLISVSSAVIILLCVIEYVVTSIDVVSDILVNADINPRNIMILLKALGICFITEFTCDCAKEAGLHSLSGNISMCGKILVLVTALPMFKEILSVVSKLTGGELNI